MGPEVYQLEQRLAAYVGVKHCITVANGTDSLHIALMALGVGPGDEVITVPFTFVSTAQVIRLCGATPVFVDISLENFMMDPQLLEKAITSRTKAIIPVSLYGQMPELEQIQAIADRHRLPLIEDGAQSFGATRNGGASCGSTLIGSTSFFPTKPLGAYGDGGALFTDDDALAEHMMAIRTHGGAQRDRYECLGYNSRLDSLQAAILLAKLSRFGEELELRSQVARRYDALLMESGHLPSIAPGNTHVYAQYTMRFENRSAVQSALEEMKIPYGIYYPLCLHLQPCFGYLGYEPGDFPVAEQASRQALSLPMHPWLLEEEQDRIALAVRRATPLALRNSTAW